ASPGSDGTVRLWDVASGRQLAELTGHTDEVSAVGFSPDGTRLASAGFDGTVRLWDVASGRQLAELTGHTGGVQAVGFSPDGTRLASAGSDGTVRLWDAASGNPTATLIGFVGGWAAVAPNGSYKLVGDPTKAIWWTINNVRFEAGELDEHIPSIRRLADDTPLPP
ncbi:WD40 repeat domain-containing protein, partial [Frankia sp. Cas3]|uniref:WD40 repeat domain-containing protein n=1 Tax=Frankia sp. Cas3 TaxID=3073926 RepID=UPI003A0FF911